MRTKRLVPRLCSFEGCDCIHYAKGWCRTHYYQTHVFGKKPTPIIHWGINYGKCKVRNCESHAAQRGYCKKHYARVLHFGRANILHRRGRKSQGGHQVYKNHSLMKKVRLIKLAADPKCELCHMKKAKLIHHIDGSKDNHSMDNLMSVCSVRCHKILHKITRAKSNCRLSQADVDRISSICHPVEFSRRQVADMFKRDQMLALEFHEKKDI